MKNLQPIHPDCFLYLAASGCPDLKVPVTSLQAASAAFQKYRDDNGIGASDLRAKCGHIFGADGKTLVAKVSYNGRVWDVNGAMLEEAYYFSN